MTDRWKQAHGRNLFTTAGFKVLMCFLFAQQRLKKIEKKNKTRRHKATPIWSARTESMGITMSSLLCVLRFVPLFAFTSAVGLMKSSFTTRKTGESTCLTPTCAVVTVVVLRADRRRPIGWRLGHLVGHWVFAYGQSCKWEGNHKDARNAAHNVRTTE